MKKKFFIAGPSQLYPTVPSHIEDALKNDILSISHRSQNFKDIYKQTTDSLRQLMGIPQDHNIFFLGSATEAMERIIENTVKSHSFHFVNGAFSKKFFKIAEQLGKKAEKIEVPLGEGFKVRSVKIPKNTECICATQNETSSGVSLAMDDIYYLKKKNPEAFAVIDVVSSAPYITIDFDLIDMAFFSVQKGFGLPAGLGVLVVGPNAVKKASALFEEGLQIGSYHNFLIMEEYARKYQTHETPNVMDIYLLGKVCQDMIKKSIKVIRNETNEKAKLIYDYFDKHPKYRPFVQERRNRSQTMIVIDVKDNAKNLISKLALRGFIVSSGYGQYKETQLRIANYPSTSFADVARLIKEFASL